MKKYALVLCALLWALGSGAVATAQGAKPAPAAGAAGALGNAQAVDETALPIVDQAGAAAGGETAVPSNLGYFLRMVFVLALVLGAIYLLMRFLRRAGRPKVQEDSALRVLASASVGPGRALHVVSLGAAAYLVGATDSAVSLIDKIDDKEFIDALALRAATEAGAPRGDFSAVLGSLLGKAKGASGKAGRRAGTEGTEGGAGPEYLARQRDRLKKFQP